MYLSTRGAAENLTAAEAIARGLASDGGLFVPVSMPQIDTQFISDLLPMSYQERAAAVLKLFLEDYTDQEIKSCVLAAYSSDKFPNPAVAPVVKVNDGTFTLELWHGPTSAFKDMALQLLPRLLSCALKKIGEQAEIVILVATSGDTGKAALEGFKNVEQTRVIVFYPADGVSEIQRLQMVTQEGENLKVVAVRGNFDDTQSGVKTIFGDKTFNDELAAQEFKLSSANSINWGRLVPQIVYYFSAYADLVKDKHIVAGTKVNFAVPTGNFGNILAGYYAKLMGLPVNKLICASNSNNVLTEFLTKGTYNRNRQFYKTHSPSMDILISSNLERLLYNLVEGDTRQVASWMEDLNKHGEYRVADKHLETIKQVFYAAWVDDEETNLTAGRVFKDYNYSIDPHTAVAWKVAEKYRQETGDRAPTVIVSTASPFKFNETVLTALGVSADDKSEFEALKALAKIIARPVPGALAELEHKAIRHTVVCEKEDMFAIVKETLNFK